MATISGMPVHSRPECLNLNVRCSSTCRCMHTHARAGAISCVLSCGGCTAWWGVARSGHDVAAAGVVECDLVACGLAVGGLVRVGGASSPLHGPGGRVLNQSMRPYRRGGVRAQAATSACVSHRMRAQGPGSRAHLFRRCAQTCARDESSLRFGRSRTSLKSSLVSSSMRSACALNDRPDTPSTPPATACRKESRRRKPAIIPKTADPSCGRRCGTMPIRQKNNSGQRNTAARR